MNGLTQEEIVGCRRLLRAATDLANAAIELLGHAGIAVESVSNILKRLEEPKESNDADRS